MLLLRKGDMIIMTADTLRARDEELADRIRDDFDNPKCLLFGIPCDPRGEEAALLLLEHHDDIAPLEAIAEFHLATTTGKLIMFN